MCPGCTSCGSIAAFAASSNQPPAWYAFPCHPLGRHLRSRSSYTSPGAWSRRSPLSISKRDYATGSVADVVVGSGMGRVLRGRRVARRGGGPHVRTPPRDARDIGGVRRGRNDTALPRERPSGRVPGRAMSWRRIDLPAVIPPPWASVGGLPAVLDRADQPASGRDRISFGLPCGV